MKLLKDVSFYAIKVDYYMYDMETDSEYLYPVYLSIDTEKDQNGIPKNLIIFRDDITPNLRVFDDLKDANEYITKKCNSPCSFENPRVIKVRFDYKENMWKESW